MKQFFLILGALFLLISCSENTPLEEIKEKTPPKKQEIVALNPIPSAVLYQFKPIEGSDFCDESKVIEGDCFMGFIYFTKNGTVVYREDCLDDTEINFFIGSAQANETGYVCSFDSVYTFNVESLESYMTDFEKHVDVNKGKLTKTDPFQVEIIAKTTCKNWGMKIETDEPNVFAHSTISIIEQPKDSYFWMDFSKIKKLKHLR